MPIKTIDGAKLRKQFGESPFGSPRDSPFEKKEKKPAPAVGPVEVGPIDVEIEVRRSTDYEKLNKTEKRFADRLEGEFHRQEILWWDIQCIGLKLGDDCRYYPDFWVIKASGIIAYEVKGFMRDDALAKLKTAARRYPWVRFVIVRWKKGAWEFEDVKP